MNIYITLDYELFFGPKCGTVEACIIRPTDALLEITERAGVHFTCFVDAGYLMALERQKSRYGELEEDYVRVCEHIRKLTRLGHGIELHIHPHWEASFYNGHDWELNTTRYKLSDFTKEEVGELVTRYCKILERISEQQPKAYRAGGWSAQPFSTIGRALQENNIYIDSTVFPGGAYESPNQCYDFRQVGRYNTHYRFSDSLTHPDLNGEFTEIPISAYRVSPYFYWQFAMAKLSKAPGHKAFGDGMAIPLSKTEILKKMILPSVSVVSMDGYKSKFLNNAFKAYVKHTQNNGNFVIIGHPKAFTPYSLKRTADFINRSCGAHAYKTFQ